MASKDAYVRPKQLTENGDSIYASLQSDADQKVREYVVSLISPIKLGSVIHDSACGSGEMFKTIMTATDPAPPSEMQIHATDHSGKVVQELRPLIAERGWPVQVANMKSQRLRFADGTFTHSILCFASHILYGYGGASDIYRTLQPGGVALVVVWSTGPFTRAIQSVHRTARADPEGRNMPMLAWGPIHDEAGLTKTLVDGGFRDEDIKVDRKSIYIDIKDPAYWVQLAWSYLGEPLSGFTQKDEDDWEKNVELLQQELRNGKGAITRDDGTLALEMIVTIVTATKT